MVAYHRMVIPLGVIFGGDFKMPTQLDATTVLLDDNATCPVCHTKIDAATANDQSGVEPHEGDISICMECTAFLIYNADLSSREMSVDELADLPPDLFYELISTRLALRRWKDGQ